MRWPPIREWLDRNQCEPAGCDCDQNGDEVVLSVDLTVDTAAEAFGWRLLTGTDAWARKSLIPQGLEGPAMSTISEAQTVIKEHRIRKRAS